MWGILDTIVIAPLYGVVSTVLAVMSWTTLLCAVVHLVGLVVGRVSRKQNLAGFALLLSLAGLFGFLEWGGDKLAFDVMHLVRSPTAGAVCLAFRVITVIAAIKPVLGLVRMTWKRAFVPGELQREA